MREKNIILGFLSRTRFPALTKGDTTALRADWLASFSASVVILGFPRFALTACIGLVFLIGSCNCVYLLWLAKVWLYVIITLFSLHFSITPFFFFFVQQVKRSNYDTEMAWKRREERVCAVVKGIIFLYFFICFRLRGKKDIKMSKLFARHCSFYWKPLRITFLAAGEFRWP